VAGIHYIVPVSVAIIALLGVVYFSYRQTIAAYPQGGSSYVVARQNLGNFAGLLAGTALIVDFILVVAVGISAGIGALVSAIPALQAHTLSLCLFVLFLITLVNLRGTRTSGLSLHVPNVHVHRVPDDHTWHWHHTDSPQRWTCDANRCAAPGRRDGTSC
jgi:amino acid transporter